MRKVEFTVETRKEDGVTWARIAELGLMVKGESKSDAVKKIEDVVYSLNKSGLLRRFMP